MPELRKDPVVGRWVIIASERARRPGNIIDTSDIDVDAAGDRCDFCENTRAPIDGDYPGGAVKVVYSIGSMDHHTEDFHRRKDGLYDVIDHFGVHEIIIETPEHIANILDLPLEQIEAVFRTYAIRMRELDKDDRFQYVLAYKNYGPPAGSRQVGHTRSHVVATPVLPLRVKEKLNGAKDYFDEHQRCVYCDLIAQEKGENRRIVHETERFVAVIPFAARFLFEMTIVPKVHGCDFQTITDGHLKDLAGMMRVCLAKLRRGIDDPSYNFVIQTAPYYRQGFNDERRKAIERFYHWHIELMPRLTRAAGFEKGTGFYICSIPPEEMAKFLKGVRVP